MELVEVELARVVIHQKGDPQYLHLRERHGSRSFSITIGYTEVEEINRKLCGVLPPRPLTHDLVGRILSTLGQRLHRVIISELKEGTFYATLVLLPRDTGTAATGSERTVDCRPSDAIALALQTGAPILVAREVFEAVAFD
jgi:bifunctional DNase/RNase